MGVAQELIGALERVRARTRPARVRALHLPPPDLAGTRQGEFCALQLDHGSIGLSYLLLDDTLERMLGHCPGAGSLAMIGPGAGCVPDPLFSRGVTSMGGAGPSMATASSMRC